MLWEKGILIYNGNAGQKGIEDTLGICVPILSPHIKELALMPTTEPKEAEKICRKHGEEFIAISENPDGVPMRYVYNIYRDSLLTDLFRKLTSD